MIHCTGSLAQNLYSSSFTSREWSRDHHLIIYSPTDRNTPRKFGRILGYALNRWKQLQTTHTLNGTESSGNNTDESPFPVSSVDSNRSWNWTNREQSSESASSADSQPDQQTKSSSNPKGPIKSEDQGHQSKQTRGSSPDNSATEEGSVQPHSEFLLVDDNSINLKASSHC